MDDVGQDPGIAELPTTAQRLGTALVGERDVDPAGEEVLGVPDALAVAEQDDGVGHVSSRRRSGFGSTRWQAVTFLRPATGWATGWTTGSRCPIPPTGRHRRRPGRSWSRTRRCRTGT